VTEKARRYNSGKLRYELLPDSLRHVVDVYTKGAHKYSLYRDTNGKVIKGSEIPIEKVGNYELIDDGANNWRKGMSWKDTIGSLKRHIAAFERGEDVDKDLNTYHLGNAAFNILTLLEYMETAPHLDDRAKNINRPLRIGLDIDGVIANFARSFKKVYPIHPSHWQITDEIDREIKKLDKDFWVNLDPLMDGNDLRFIPACYITKKDGCKVEWIEKWLKINGFPLAPITIVEGSKVDACVDNDIDIYVDDNYHNYMDLNANGISCFLFDSKHNQKYEVGGDRIMSLNDLVTKFKITG